MIPRDATPIGHVSPLPPIDLNYRWPVNTDNCGPGFTFSPTECDRIWKLVKQAAESSNIGEMPEAAE